MKNYFLAVDVPEHIEDLLSIIQSELISTLPDISFIKWQKPEKFHVTLQFLGTTPLNLGKVRTKPFMAHLQGLSFFYIGPIILYARVYPLNKWEDLARAIGNKEFFTPHITLARFDDNMTPEQWWLILEAAHNISAEWRWADFEVNSFSLYSTEKQPDQKRSIYTKEKEWELSNVKQNAS